MHPKYILKKCIAIAEQYLILLIYVAQCRLCGSRLSETYNTIELTVNLVVTDSEYCVASHTCHAHKDRQQNRL